MKSKKSFVASLLFVMAMVTVFITGRQETFAGNKPYYIKVNKGTNVVTVYKSNGTPDRAFVCSTGSATPVGTFSTSQKLRWHVLMGPSYGQYCTRITGSILFHSVWYYTNRDKASQSTIQYNRLGTTASHGCVRLTVGDSKWIYDNCPLGTKVTVFNGSSKDDPLGKPVAITVSTASRRGWDPTDPDSANPYLDKEPTITLDKNSYTVNFGSRLDIRDIASARTAYGPYLNSKLVVKVNVPGSKKNVVFKGKHYTFNKMGTYVVTYSVKDPKNGKTTTKKLTVKVADTGNPIISGTKKSQYVEYKKTLNLKTCVNVKTASGTNLKNSLVVKITRPDNKTFTLKENIYTFKRLGKYKVVYTAKNPATGKTAKKTVVFTVRNTKAPVFSGLKDSTKEYRKSYNVKSGVKAKEVTGKSVTSKIKVYVYSPSGKKVSVKNNKITLSYRGTYKIKYTVTGTNKKKATKVIKVKSVDTGAPVLKNVPATAKKAGYKTSVKLGEGIKAVTSKGTSLTKYIKIKVVKPNKKINELSSSTVTYCFNSIGTYKVTYTVVNPNGGKSASKSVKYVVNFQPKLTVPTSYTYDLKSGTKKVNVFDGVTCKDTTVKSVSLLKYAKASVTYKSFTNGKISKVTLANNAFTINKPGKYTVNYEVSGTNVNTLKKSKVITVVDSSDKVYTPIKDATVANIGDVITPANLVSVKTKSGANLTSHLLVSAVLYSDENGTSGIELKDGKFTIEKAGTYIVNYEVNNNILSYYKGKNNSYKITIVVKEIIDDGNDESNNEDGNKNSEESGENNEGIKADDKLS